MDLIIGLIVFGAVTFVRWKLRNRQQNSGKITVYSDSGQKKVLTPEQHSFRARVRQRTETLDDGNPRWPYQRALTLYETGGVQEALSALDRALELAPEEAALHWHRGSCWTSRTRPRRSWRWVVRPRHQRPKMS